MNPAHLAAILAGAAMIALVGAWVSARLARWRRKSPQELERLRRLDVNRRGRITAGWIIDFIDAEPADGARLIVYKYELAGVTYEAAQDVSAFPAVLALARHATDQPASVKYDPKVPTNSIVACEEWCGVRGQEPGFGVRDSRPGAQRSEVEAAKKD